MFINSKKRKRGGDVRDFPFPYSAMMSICSDLDETPNASIYFDISRYLNTDKETSIGNGVNLEVGNTIYFDMPEGQFSYCNTDDVGREAIHKLMRSGHVDVVHSFGDYAESRERIAEHIEELKKNSCELKVWVDHAVAPSNFGADIMRGRGDDMFSETYHADISLDYGIKYIWMGRVTSVIGQGVKRTYSGIINRKHFITSVTTVLKEMAKVFLGKVGTAKYRLHRLNDLLAQKSLRSGQTVIEFMRCNPYWGGVSGCETAYGIKHVLNSMYLEELIRSRGYSILYTHLGKVKDINEPFDKETKKAFELLSRYYSEKKILVTTTRRLLDYYSMLRSVEYSVEKIGERYLIDIVLEEKDQDISGLTIYLPEDVENVEIKFGKNPIPDIQYNDPDETGLRSVSVLWEKLKYPI